MSKLLGVCFLALTSAFAEAACDCEPPFEVTTKRDDDRVSVQCENDQAVFSVHSPAGTSQAVIEEAGAKWPESVVLRLRLSGLEHFKISSRDVTLEGSATLQGGEPVVRIFKDGKEDAPLDDEDPYWIKVRIFGSDGKPAKAIPLEDGYFEMEVPQALFERNAKSITVEWIDFYRN